MSRVRDGSGRRWWWLAAGAAAFIFALWMWRLAHMRESQGPVIAVLGLAVSVLALVATVVFGVPALRSGGAEGKTLLSAAQRLAGAVRAQELAALARLVADTGDARPADVAFAQPGLLYWRSDGGDHRSSLGQIEPYYRGLKRGRLVVLGEAGAGKTVLVIQLIRDLAAAIVDASTSREGVGGRLVVPVRLSLSAFDPEVGEGNVDDVAGEQLAERLDQWVAGYLVTVYGVPKKVAAALVAGGWVLPVLDGLDEMDPVGQRPRRAAALVRALNQPTADGLRPVVLTCRTGRYAQLTGHPLSGGDDQARATAWSSIGEVAADGESAVVQDATVVVIEPLSVPDVIAYLSYRFPDPGGSGHCEPRWTPVVERLTADQDGDPVVAALRSPLRLFLATTGYRRAASDPGMLTQYNTAAQLNDHLFGLLVPAVTAQHPCPTGDHYPATDIARWLTTLARHLHREREAGRSGTDLRLDALWPAAGDRAPRYLAATVLGVVAAAPILLLVGFVIPTDPFWYRGPAFYSFLGIAVALVVATAWLLSRCSVDLQQIDLRALTTAGRRRLAGQFVGVPAAVVGFLLADRWLRLSARLSPPGYPPAPLVGLITSVLVIVLGRELVRGLTARPVAIDLPRRIVSQGLAHTALLLAFGLVTGLAYVWGFEGGVFITTAGYPLQLGFALAIFNIRRSPWPRYAVACLLLARRGELPRRPAVMLDWAYDAGLVRLSGIAVQFRHREFQDWLTTRDRNDPTSVAPPPSTTAGTTAPVGGE